MKLLLSLTPVLLLVLLAAACSSEPEPLTGAQFRAELTEDLLEDIQNANLSEGLALLATDSLAVCMEDTTPTSKDDLDDFADCYAETLCGSALVAPVWAGNEAACIEEAKAGFELGD